MKTRAVLLTLACALSQVEATGWFGPMVYLDGGGNNVAASPEFYWDLELKRIAREFRAPEKLLKPDASTADDTSDRRAGLFELTAKADIDDFDDALRNGNLKPPDAAAARKAHEAARQAIEAVAAQLNTSLPEELPSEFADYHRGALAYRKGAEHFGEARDAWNALLNRPPEQRHYRSVWATFMLGKLALKAGAPDAQTWFQKTRELARQGFADSLGFAADSYGWEARAEWKQDDPEQAARLFLTQLALGDESAVVSIKALVPDRQPIGGMLNYNIVESGEADAWIEPHKKFSREEELQRLERAVKDRVLRRLVTAHILATGSSHAYFSNENESAAARAKRWLQIVKGADLARVEDAEYLGWTAYMHGDYDDAAHWLKLSSGTTPAALWLKAKLARRDGRLSEATKAMADAWKILRDERAYTGWAGTSQVSDYYSGYSSGYVYRRGELAWTLSQEASGDFAALHLQRADFVQALDIFFKGDLWNDAAYVAERVLTTTELKHYVDQLPRPDRSATPVTPYEFGWQSKMPTTAKMRYLLGRRLAREHRYDDAARYLAPPFDVILRRYSDALRVGEDIKRSKAERALALFRAAWIARYDGMELMGTEMAPDGFTEAGSYEVPDIAQQRVSGYADQLTTTGQKKVPSVLQATRDEVKRVANNAAKPYIRFHYRLLAAELAIKASALLPNNSEEAADVINAAGLWTKDEDEKIADHYFDLLEKRVPETAIGRAAIARRWFVSIKGPWSTTLEAEEKGMKKELGLRDPYEELETRQPSPTPTPSPSAIPGPSS